MSEQAVQKVVFEESKEDEAAAAQAASMEFDLGNLAAFDYSAVDKKRLKKSKKDERLLEAATKSAQALMKQLCDLPSEAVLDGRLIVLPDTTMRLPREKPIPKPKEKTRWEKFAEQKGIKKRKRDRMVWDEKHQEYRPRWGYKKANDDSSAWVMEHRPGDDPTVDPWSQMKRDKKQRVAKNELKRINNLQQASGERVPGTLDLAAAVNANAKGKKQKQKQKNTPKGKYGKGDHHVDVAMKLAQHSTRSMGKFDELRKYEQKPKSLEKPKKPSNALSAKGEAERNMKVLERLMRGSSGNGASSYSSGVNVTKAVRFEEHHAKRQRKAQKQSKN